MDNGAVPDILLLHRPLLQEHVGPRLAGKSKAAVAVGGQGDEGQGSNGLFAQLRVDDPHTVLLHRLHQEAAEIVVAHAAAYPHRQPAAGGNDRRVARRTAGIADIAGRLTAGGKVDYKLSNAVQVHHASAFLNIVNHNFRAEPPQNGPPAPCPIL